MTRNASLDALRILAAFMVVAIHGSAPFVVNVDTTSRIWWEAHILNSFSRVAVDIFILISGSLLLNRIITPLEFYKKRITKLLIPFFVWSAVYALLTQYENGIGQIIETTVTFSGYYHLWFCPLILMLYLATPWLSQLHITIFPFFVLAILSMVLLFFPADNSYQPLGGYIFLFLAGKVLGNLSLSPKYFLPFLGLFFLSQTFTIIITAYKSSEVLYQASYHYFYLSNIMGAMALFMAFQNFSFSYHFSQRLNFVSQTTLGIYLMHPLWLIVLPTLSPIAITLAAFLLSFLCVKIFSFIPYIRRIILP